jgi:hypothetical protein
LEEEEEGGRHRAEGQPSPRSPRAVGSVASGEREGAYRRDGRGKRSFLKENQKLTYIFAGPDSNENQKKLGKSTKSDDKLEEADPNRSGYKQRWPHDRRSDGWKQLGWRGSRFYSRSRR